MLTKNANACKKFISWQLLKLEISIFRCQACAGEVGAWYHDIVFSSKTHLFSKLMHTVYNRKKVAKISDTFIVFLKPAIMKQVPNRQKSIRDLCYDQKFMRFLPIFSEKIGVFLKNQYYDEFFSKTSSSRHFLPNFSAKIF
jgi:hypothetical protein